MTLATLDESDAELATQREVPPPAELPDYTNIIRNAVRQLINGSRPGSELSEAIIRGIHMKISAAYQAARIEGGEVFDSVREVHKGVWGASLRANKALVLHSLQRLDVFDYDTALESPHGSAIHEYNRLIASAVSGNASLMAGSTSTAIDYSVDAATYRERIVSHMKRMRTLNSNHRFASSVAVDQVLKQNNS